MEPLIHILHLEDDAADAQLVRAILEEAGLACRITLVQTREEYDAALRQGEYDLILADFRLPGYDGMAALRLMQELGLEAPFIFVSGTMGEEAAIEGLTKGATDYVLKQKLSRLVPAIMRALGDAENRRERQRAERLLAEQFQFLHLLIDTIPSPIFFKNANGVYLGCNQSLAEFIGRPKDAIIGKTVFDIYPKEQAEKYFHMDQELFQHPGTQIYEFIMEGADGSIRNFIFTKATFVDFSGQVAGLIGVMTDITERKQAEEALRQTNETLRATLDAAPVAILDLDTEGRVKSLWNPAAEQMLGWRRDEVLGQFLPTVPEDCTEEFARFRDWVRSGKQILGNEVVRRRKDGSPIEYSIYAAPEYDADGQVSGNIAVLVDITERKEAEKEIARLASFPQLDPSPVLEVDLKGHITFANLAARAIARQLGLPDVQALLPDDLPEIFQGGMVTAEEVVRREKQVDTAVFAITISFVPQFQTARLYFMDITERKRAEEEISAAAQKWRTTFDAITDAVFLMDQDGVILQCNQALAALVGKPFTDILGQHCYKVIHGSSQPIQDCPLVRMRQSRQREELLLPMGDRWYKVGVDPLLDEGGNLTGAVHIITDVTQLRETEKSLYRRTEELTLLNAIGSIVSRSLDLKVILEDSLGMIQQNLFGKQSRSIVFLLEKATGKLKAVSHRGVPEDHPCLGSSVTMGECLCGRAALNGEIVFTREGCKNQRESSLSPDIAPHHDISLPLKVGNRLLGVLHLSVNLDQEVDERQLKLLQAISDQISVAVERTRLFEEVKLQGSQLRALTNRLAEIEEAERRHLARELHDHVGQSLTTLNFYLTILQQQMSEQMPEKSMALLADATVLMNEIADSVRDVMAGLRPPVLDDFGLMAAVRWYGKRFSKSTGIAVEVEGEDPVPRLDRNAEMSLFRITQEALTNVAKHARASRVKVTGEVHDSTVKLIIADNGIGFYQTQVSQPEGCQHWGLMNMSERAIAAGGTCRLESRPGSGTRVIVEVNR